MRQDDTIRIRHMLDAAREAISFAEGHNRSSLDGDRLLVLALVRCGDPNLDQITAEDLGGDYPAVEYGPPHGAYSLDILARLGEAFRYEDLEANEMVVDGVRIRVATPRMLYRMKRGTVRPQDRLDAETIRQRFGLAEEE